jgi:hypothetical protein
MNRHELLKDILSGRTTEPRTAQEVVLWEWCTLHSPLASPNTFSGTGRYLNHFCVGSDPEFSLVRPEDGTRIEAFNTGLKVGLATGVDQNERLVELRPYPSVSVVEHVAGILTDLRWCFRVYNRYMAAMYWRAGAYFAGDGMGGHVHFGRKRPTRVEEVAALDGLARALKNTGLFPIREWDRRMQGDERRQRYGLPGDFRVQKHGYEYRSLPSWLQSPKVAFIALACSKLAILDPAITTTWNHVWHVEDARNALRGLAKLYKGRDDDAYILYHLLTEQGDNVFLVDHTGDFAAAWGIDRRIVSPKEEWNYILPACIEPNSSEIKEIHDHLLLGTQLQFQFVEPNFVFEIPAKFGYTWVPAFVSPRRFSGFGDLLHNLVTHKDAPIMWEYGNHDEMKIVGGAVNTWTAKEVAFVKEFYPDCQINKGGSLETWLVVPRCLCQAQTITSLRDLLLHSGLFPIWTVDTVQPDSFAKWLTERPKATEFKIWRSA